MWMSACWGGYRCPAMAAEFGNACCDVCDCSFEKCCVVIEQKSDENGAEEGPMQDVGCICQCGREKWALGWL